MPTSRPDTPCPRKRRQSVQESASSAATPPTYELTVRQHGSSLCLHQSNGGGHIALGCWAEGRQRLPGQPGTRGGAQKSDGKRNGAVGVVDERAAQGFDASRALRTVDFRHHVTSSFGFNRDDIVDVFSTDSQDVSEESFQHSVNMSKRGVEGKRRVMATFDGGALIGALCSRVWQTLEGDLRVRGRSNRILRMANGSLVPSQGVWTGRLEMKGVPIMVRLEIFDSGGSWEVLVGKPILRQARAVHDYAREIITLNTRCEGGPPVELRAGGGLEAEEAEAVEGQTSCPEQSEEREEHVEVAKEFEAEAVDVAPISEVRQNVFTRATDPFQEARVQKILEEVQIGSDLTDKQRDGVRALVKEFADCFALSMGEVNAVPGAVHKLNVPEGSKFSIRPGQKKLTPEQRKFRDAKIDEMLDAGVIRQIHPSEVLCSAPTVLAPKPYDDGLSLAELQHLVNDECISHGLPSFTDLPPRPPERAESSESKPPRWRICHNFSEINKVTEIAPMPQGDIRQKQQNLSGHRYVHVFDFAAGFYAITVHPESQPYITFYVEGRGYFAYVRMPFGVTGGPSEFAHFTALRLHDLIADGTCELFVDDGGSASDSYDEGMGKLRRILERVRKEKLSLAPSKMRLFMTEAVFAGATVGPKGVSPDIGKLSTVAQWPIPQDASHLEGFLGLTSWFRDLIRGYASVEKPLRDLLRAVPIPKGTKKSQYQRIMKGYKLADVWKDEHTKAFMALKMRLVSEPVLCAPRFDGTPFILTTDGCIDAFAGVLAQKIKTTIPGGKTVTRLHPIGFVSKRTSPSEEKYKPFLLEFAALKFALDKFSDIVYGHKVEIETDCQALRDVLLSDRLNATHVRWRDSVMAHNIVAVRHIPGTINIADGLSRHYEGLPKGGDDGSSWSVDPDSDDMVGIAWDVLGVESLDSQLQALRERFKDEPYFSDVIDALLEIQPNRKIRLRDRQRAQHRAENFMVEGGKLWYIGGGTKIRAVSRRECVTKAEAVELARQEHENGGHWHRDGIKIALLDRIHRPGLDEIIVLAISSCARCKNFGATHLHSLLQPITRRHPFELLVGDYLKLPVGKGGYHTVGLYLDTFSQHVWGYMFKTHGSTKTTTKSLGDIFHTFAPPEMFMSDGGKHFDNTAVTDFCAEWGTDTDIVAAYSPWVNGLVEGTNKLLLYVLARLCAPEVGEDGWETMDWKDLPRSWPDHFEKAIRILNWRILPALKFSPKELLLGLVINTAKTPLEASSSILPPKDIDTQITYVAQQRLDGYSEAVRHAIRRKAIFDRKVEKSRAGVVVFEEGQLVQVYRSDLYNTLSSERKLTPMWSGPKRVKERLTNSYELEELDGTPISGRYSARRLRAFEPRMGTRLWEDEKRRKGGGVEVEPGGVVEADPASDDGVGLRQERGGEGLGVFYDEDENAGEEGDGALGDSVAGRLVARLTGTSPC
ncbi:hypothetical protein NMY22_g16851 [Coprinellus aureogranulatus]|nr:hypothetical protein NMY22_g16851 [Coprinellus aureogranulatus]